jgi:beta-glucosidase
VTFDRSWGESASNAYYYPIEHGDTVLHKIEPDGSSRDYTIPHVHYGDGLLVGYRYWTTSGKHPLYSFGFGLSYTSFRFSNLRVGDASDNTPLQADLRLHR